MISHHLHDEENRHLGYVCASTNQRYVARVRRKGGRRYQILGKPTKSKRVALRRLADAFATGSYKRGDVLLTADWYEPTQIYELVKK